jgi:ubiquinone/menaquinone biosynthesis C-methylase UbiE
MAQTLLKAQPGLDLTVVDLDPEMVAAGQRRLNGTAARVEVADSGALRYPDDTFDVVASSLMLHHLVDWHPTIAEAARVLRPGGRLVGYDLTRTNAAVLFHRLDRSRVHILTESQIRSALVGAGFEPVEVEVARGGHWMRFRAYLPGVP